MMKTGLRRDELLRPGQYAALPKTILSNAKLTPAAKLVLMAYIDHLGPENTTSWPGPATIARETGLTRRGVQKCVEKLMAAGLLTLAEKPLNHPANTLVFAVNAEPCPPRVADCDKESQCATPDQPAPSAQNSLPLANGVRYQWRTECATPSAQSSPELLNGTTGANNRSNDRRDTGPLAGASAERPHTPPAWPSSLPFGFAPSLQAEGTAGPTPSAFVRIEVLTAASPVVTEEFDNDGVGPERPFGWDDGEEAGVAGEDGAEEDQGETRPRPLLLSQIPSRPPTLSSRPNSGAWLVSPLGDEASRTASRRPR